MLFVTGVPLSKDANLIKKYSQFVLNKFVTRSLQRKSIIVVRVIDPEDLTDPEEKKELKESCAWTTYDGPQEDGKKRFTVTMTRGLINKRAKKQIKKYKNFLKDLGHELIHVKQYINNELFDYADGEIARFRGKKYPNSIAIIDWKYWDSPWEVEAYGRMEGLYSMFVRKLKEDKKKA